MTLSTHKPHRHLTRWSVEFFRRIRFYYLSAVLLFFLGISFMLIFFYITPSQSNPPPSLNTTSFFQNGIEYNLSVKQEKYTNDAYKEEGDDGGGGGGGEGNQGSYLDFEKDIKNALEDTRQDIENELIGYRFPPGVSLKNLVPKKGGTPIRTIIISTWRSGSTFLGGILQSNPGTMYHYEPLKDFGCIQFRGPPFAHIERLKHFLTCDYTNLENNYLAHSRKDSWALSENTRVWKQCQGRTSLCWSPQFWGPQCQLFPFQLMKVVRLRLSMIEEILDDKNLNVRVLLLVRDPRGTMHSRYRVDWCEACPDCWDPLQLCSDLVADYAAALRFYKKFPKRFRAIRYEDLSLDPYKTAGDLFKFLGLSLSPKTVEFIQNHTKTNFGDWHSTFRDSKSTPFRWRTGLRHTRVRDIQSVCRSALNLWGYVLAENATHLHGFNPLLPSFQMH